MDDPSPGPHSHSCNPTGLCTHLSVLRMCLLKTPQDLKPTCSPRIWHGCVYMGSSHYAVTKLPQSLSPQMESTCAYWIRSKWRGVEGKVQKSQRVMDGWPCFWSWLLGAVCHVFLKHTVKEHLLKCFQVVLPKKSPWQATQYTAKVG